MNIRLSLKENFNDKKNKEHVALMVILSAFFIGEIMDIQHVLGGPKVLVVMKLLYISLQKKCRSKFGYSVLLQSVYRLVVVDEID